MRHTRRTDETLPRAGLLSLFVDQRALDEPAAACRLRRPTATDGDGDRLDLPAGRRPCEALAGMYAQAATTVRSNVRLAPKRSGATATSRLFASGTRTKSLTPSNDTALSGSPTSAPATPSVGLFRYVP